MKCPKNWGNRFSLGSLTPLKLGPLYSRELNKVERKKIMKLYLKYSAHGDTCVCACVYVCVFVCECFWKGGILK